MLPFFKENKRSFYLSQDADGEGYTILNHKKKEIQYVSTKMVTSRGFYEIRDSLTSEKIGEVKRMPIAEHFKLYNEKSEEIAIVNFSEKGCELDFNNQKFKSSALQRAKSFNFEDESKNYAFTIDKKILSVNDKYHIIHSKNFPSMIAVMVSICIDSFYHEDTKN